MRSFIFGDPTFEYNRKKIKRGRKVRGGVWPAGWDEGEMGGFNPKVVLALSLKACPQFCTSFISP